MKPEPCELDRFIEAQQAVYPQVIAELKQGKKHSHWMWFIFPQLTGLGRSEIAQFYAIKDLSEAQQYLQHPILGQRLIECTQLVLATKNKSITEIFGTPDNLKFLSCMTLFFKADDSVKIFDEILDVYFDHKLDQLTVNILGQ